MPGVRVVERVRSMHGNGKAPPMSPPSSSLKNSGAEMHHSLSMNDGGEPILFHGLAGVGEAASESEKAHDSGYRFLNTLAKMTSQLHLASTRPDSKKRGHKYSNDDGVMDIDAYNDGSPSGSREGNIAWRSNSKHMTFGSNRLVRVVESTIDDEPGDRPRRNHSMTIDKENAHRYQSSRRNSFGGWNDPKQRPLGPTTPEKRIVDPRSLAAVDNPQFHSTPAKQEPTGDAAAETPVAHNTSTSSTVLEGGVSPHSSPCTPRSETHHAAGCTSSTYRAFDFNRSMEERRTPLFKKNMLPLSPLPPGSAMAMSPSQFLSLSDSVHGTPARDRTKTMSRGRRRLTFDDSAKTPTKKVSLDFEAIAQLASHANFSPVRGAIRVAANPNKRVAYEMENYDEQADGSSQVITNKLFGTSYVLGKRALTPPSSSPKNDSSVDLEDGLVGKLPHTCDIVPCSVTLGQKLQTINAKLKSNETREDHNGVKTRTQAVAC